MGSHELDGGSNLHPPDGGCFRFVAAKPGVSSRRRHTNEQAEYSLVLHRSATLRHDPHPPFDPPGKYLDRYSPEELRYPLFREGDIERQRGFSRVDQQTVEAVSPHEAEKHPPPEWGVKTEKYAGSEPPRYYDPRKVKACYYASIELIDHEFGRLLDYLESTGEIENTIVIFTSDHGELLGDHGFIYKGCRFFESLVHVPLVVSWPGSVRSGLKSDALVELVDLETDPGEFENLWEVPEYASLKCKLLTRHFNALMLSSGAGISRSAGY